jgi:hypothetical protein
MLCGMKCSRPGRRRSACLALAAAACLAGGISAGQAPSTDASFAALLDSAAAYVKDYQATLTFILADEQYTQEIRAQIPVQPQMPRTRTLSSTAFFMFLPSSGDWMSIRDVLTVDGKPVADRPDVQAELQRLPPEKVGESFKNYNSRFNLGRVYRNFNEPTLSLLVLDPQYRANFTFRRKGTRTVARRTLVSVAFNERPSDGPLIRDLQLKPTLSAGELLVDPATGAVHQASLDVTIGGLRVQLSTSYVRDERLAVLVPAVFREQYTQGVDPLSAPNRMPLARTGQYEVILCQASYSNFRRFEAAARIK